MDESLLDTDIYSEILRAKNPYLLAAARAYRAEHGAFQVSAATVVELVKGLHQARRLENLSKVLHAIETEEVIPLDRALAVTAGEIYGELLRTGQGIGRIDPMIAATAIEKDLVLVTGNIRHFQRVVDLGFPLQLANWRDE